MTLIAIACHADRVEVVTDSLTSDTYCRRVWDNLTSKVHPVPRLAAITTSTGRMLDGIAWADLAARYSMSSVDALVSILNPADLGIDDPNTILYLAGWSQLRHRFATWSWAPFTDWRPVLLDTIHVQPHPFGHGPRDDLMQQRLAYEQTAGRAADDIVLPSGPTLDPPANLAAWRDLVVDVRRTRAVADGHDIRLRNVVGGTVTRCTLTRDRVDFDTVAVLDTPDHLGSDFADMFTWTWHPTAQVRPCAKPGCDSGRPFHTCHGVRLRGRPCICGSARLYDDCCEFDPDRPEDPLPRVLIAPTCDGVTVVPTDTAAACEQACPSCGSLSYVQITSSRGAGHQCTGCGTSWRPPSLPVPPVSTAAP